jgi:hypothetical protein
MLMLNSFPVLRLSALSDSNEFHDRALTSHSDLIDIQLS